MDRHFLKVLKKELPRLHEKNIIDNDTVQKIEVYYKSKNLTDKKSLILTVLGTLAALLIGSGIILLFAHNWYEFNRFLKTSLSFIPLLTGQILIFYSVIKKRSHSWVEFSTLFLVLSVGSVIALISQIYHIPGDTGNFILLWMLLILPLIYLTDGSAIIILYLSGILVWSAYSQEMGRHALWYWLLLGAIIPRVSNERITDPHSNRTYLLTWTMIINLIIGTGISLEKILPGLWILIYSLLFSLGMMIGYLWKDKDSRLFHNPFKNAGAAGTYFLTYLLSFRFFWKDVGFDNLRKDNLHIKNAAYFDYILFICLVVLGIILFIKIIKRGKRRKITTNFLLFPLSLTGFLLASFSDLTIIQSILFNGYGFFLGAKQTIRGIKESSLWRLNFGMAFMVLIILTRFFDMDVSFTVKG